MSSQSSRGPSRSENGGTPRNGRNKNTPKAKEYQSNKLESIEEESLENVGRRNSRKKSASRGKGEPLEVDESNQQTRSQKGKNGQQDKKRKLSELEKSSIQAKEEEKVQYLPVPTAKNNNGAKRRKLNSNGSDMGSESQFLLVGKQKKSVIDEVLDSRNLEDDQEANEADVMAMLAKSENCILDKLHKTGDEHDFMDKIRLQDRPQRYIRRFVNLDGTPIIKDQPIHALAQQFQMEPENFLQATVDEGEIVCNQAIFQRSQADGGTRIMWSIMNLGDLVDTSNRVVSPVFTTQDGSQWQLIYQH
ncbi:hypothetical protein FGO68_gene3513 [Halteria grandinella]|uniref:Uncharacterized protein n=1 Tax=Halteria grandinella TaxID=5974 RepID=A0A8J8SY35_HALGN|nr:hypothetical protein FGO68_gene3513 [Halteria grandinella]